MTRQRLGHGDEAVGLLKKAVDRTDAVLAADRTEGAGPPWNRRLTLELLRREAENLSDAPEDAAKRVEETERRPP